MGVMCTCVRLLRTQHDLWPPVGYLHNHDRGARVVLPFCHSHGVCCFCASNARTLGPKDIQATRELS